MEGRNHLAGTMYLQSTRCLFAPHLSIELDFPMVTHLFSLWCFHGGYFLLDFGLGTSLALEIMSEC